MNEIAELLQQRVGLSPEQSQEAARAIIELIMSKVPPQFQGIVSGILGGEGAGGEAGGGELGGLLGMAEGLFGHKG